MEESETSNNQLNSFMAFHQKILHSINNHFINNHRRSLKKLSTSIIKADQFLKFPKFRSFVILMPLEENKKIPISELQIFK